MQVQSSDVCEVWGAPTSFSTVRFPYVIPNLLPTWMRPHLSWSCAVLLARHATLQ